MLLKNLVQLRLCNFTTSVLCPKGIMQSWFLGLFVLLGPCMLVSYEDCGCLVCTSSVGMCSYVCMLYFFGVKPDLQFSVNCLAGKVLCPCEWKSAVDKACYESCCSVRVLIYLEAGTIGFYMSDVLTLEFLFDLSSNLSANENVKISVTK